MPKSRINKAMNANSPTVLGLDIGGANIKIACEVGRAVSIPFALWKQPDRLPAVLASLVEGYSKHGDFAEIAITMTGELCDCFATKREGVNRILDAVVFAAAGKPLRVWSTAGKWLSVADARLSSLAVAAANWHALATFAGRFAPVGKALLVDIGSTTTDIIPLENGVPVSKGRTDFDRLELGELVYLGVKRTPVMALGVPNVCAEYFADTRDVNIVLNHIAEVPVAIDTADGRPATMSYCLARLARMLGGDPESHSEASLRSTAAHWFRHSKERISDAIRVAVNGDANRIERIGGSQILIMSGAGEWMVRKAWWGVDLEFTGRMSLADELDEPVSACAPAYAVAVLASEMPR